MKEPILLVYCTVGDDQEAKRIAESLLNKNLVACCNIINGVKSIYRWEGTIESSDESLLMMKTTEKHYEQLEKEIKMVHSYSVPEIIATQVVKGSNAYIDWILENLKS